MAEHWPHAKEKFAGRHASRTNGTGSPLEALVHSVDTWSDRNAPAKGSVNDLTHTVDTRGFGVRYDRSGYIAQYVRRNVGLGVRPRAGSCAQQERERVSTGGE